MNPDKIDPLDFKPHTFNKKPETVKQEYPTLGDLTEAGKYDFESSNTKTFTVKFYPIAWIDETPYVLNDDEHEMEKTITIRKTITSKALPHQSHVVGKGYTLDSNGKVSKDGYIIGLWHTIQEQD